MLGAAGGDVAGEGTDGREALVAGAGRAASAVLDVCQEGEYALGTEVTHGHPVDRHTRLAGDEGKQKSQRVAVSDSQPAASQGLGKLEGVSSQALKPIGMAMAIFEHERDGALTMEGAAEYFWRLFIEQLR